MTKTITNIVMSLAAMLLVVTGCTPTSTPNNSTSTNATATASVDLVKIEKYSIAVGYATAYACKLNKNFTTNVQETVVKILQTVSSVIPSETETFAEKWQPIVTAELTKLMDAKAVDETMAGIVNSFVSKLIKNLDGYIVVKHPEWKKSNDVLAAVVKSFSEAYIKVVTPNTALAADDITDMMDNEAFENVK